MKTLGQHLHELREREDLSLRELGGKIKVSAAFLSDVELGRRYPSGKLLEKIARFFRVSVKDLRAYDSRPPVDEIKRKAARDPSYGFALRKLVSSGSSSEEILKFVEKQIKRNKKRQE